jgi:hypothetical protein
MTYEGADADCVRWIQFGQVTLFPLVVGKDVKEKEGDGSWGLGAALVGESIPPTTTSTLSNAVWHVDSPSGPYYFDPNKKPTGEGGIVPKTQSWIWDIPDVASKAAQFFFVNGLKKNNNVKAFGYYIDVRFDAYAVDSTNNNQVRGDVEWYDRGGYASLLTLGQWKVQQTVKNEVQADPLLDARDHYGLMGVSATPGASTYLAAQNKLLGDGQKLTLP